MNICGEPFVVLRSVGDTEGRDIDLVWTVAQAEQLGQALLRAVQECAQAESDS